MNTGTIKNEGLMWGNLLHLGYNMWGESDCVKWDHYIEASPVLRFDKEIWDEILEQMVAAGMNTVVIDLGEGVRYESHPEIAVEGSWDVDYLRKELDKIRKMGLKPIPKLNFSAAHDEWLGEYSRCVSTKIYYQVCRDLINEVIEIFDTPELFHIGMDEETYLDQRFNTYAVVRNGDLWWHDLYFLVDLVEKRVSVPGCGLIICGTTRRNISGKCPNPYCKATGTTAAFCRRRARKRQKASGLTGYWRKTAMTRSSQEATGAGRIISRKQSILA